MATIVLSAAGAALGSALGPAGTVVGQILGAVAGNTIDRALIQSTLPDMKATRLSDMSVQTSQEGQPVPRVYGRARVPGALIWATRHEEKVTEEDAGGKGGPTMTTYRYHANVAFALCEGPIHRVGRIWADGIELDQEDVEIRVHLGGEDQDADPLIEARQPNGTPAYRGTAYVVFEHFPLKHYGNRLPQFTFEVVRAVDRLEPMVRAVTLIPGATEYGYGAVMTTRGAALSGYETENRHQTVANSDLAASLDELTALCPNLERVALVVAWFGDDLRAGACRIAPRVEATDKAADRPWSVAGLGRAAATPVSRSGGGPAYGGTPADATVVEAIVELRRRGLKVVLYPFVMMDVPAGNALTDPYGAERQAAYPWRGRITCQPAPGRPGSPDGTAAVAAEVAAFLGAAAPAHFTVGPGTVAYAGPDEWRYRRMILHYAALAEAAGGVDAFLIGSELRGLTTLRSGPSSYPFVAGLAALAADVSAILRPETRVTYAADWSEWFGHRPADGSGDVFFHLDPLWASPHVDMIGIDAYWPLSDWRHGPCADAAVADGPHDLDHLTARLGSGEGFDWYYADAAARRAGTRTPITDGAHGKPWVFRDKDLVSWWSNPHHDRPGGVEAAAPTAWVPKSKPFWLTEVGCAAVDLGANQPNLFPDPKSSESGLPHFSRGARDDLGQRRTLEAVLRRFDPAAPGFQAAWNPLSPIDGRRMVDPAGIHLWTWDARPFPAFPAMKQVWSDATNWAAGHWLAGRLGGTSVEGLIAAVLADWGYDGAVDYRAVAGHLDGWVVADRVSARDALEPILAAFLIDAADTGTGLRFTGRARRSAVTLGLADLAEPETGPRFERRRAQESELPASVAVTVSDALRDYRRTTVKSRRLVGDSRRETRADLPGVLPVEVAVALADTWLQDLWAARERVTFALPPSRVALEPGDLVDLAFGDRQGCVVIERIEDTGLRRVEARSVDPALYRPIRALPPDAAEEPPAALGPPAVEILDLPPLPGAADPQAPRLAAFVEPWPGALAVWREDGDGGYALAATIETPATTGSLAASLPPGPVAVWDEVSVLRVRLHGGHLASAPDAAVLGGANLAAIRAPDGRLEFLQFGTAELVGPSEYRLSHLLRAQAGSEDAWAGGAMPAGSLFVLIDAALTTLPTRIEDLGRPVGLRIGPARKSHDHASYLTTTATPAGRGLRPWSPVAPEARLDRVSGAVAFSWIRRSRVAGADGWDEAEPPLGEESERWRLEILSGTEVVRRVETVTASWVYGAAEQAADFGAPAAAYTVRITQIGTFGPGIPRIATLTL